MANGIGADFLQFIESPEFQQPQQPTTSIQQEGVGADFLQAIEPQAGGIEGFARTAAEGVGGIVSQFQQGAETAERGLTETLGLQPPEGRRAPITPPENILESVAKLSGEFFAPLPQTGGIPGLGQAINQGINIAGDVVRSAPAFNSFKNVIGKLSRGARNATKARFADVVRFFSDVPEESTLRLLEKGNKIFKKEFLNPNEVSAPNRRRTQESLSKGFRLIGDQFDKEVEPIINPPKGSTFAAVQVDISDAVTNFVNDLVESDIIRLKNPGQSIQDTILKKQITKGLGDTEGTLTRGVKNIFDAINLGDKRPTLRTIHDLRKRIDNIKFGSQLKDNVNASSAIRGLRQNLVEQFPDEYKQINQRFANLFDLQDEFGLGGTSKRPRGKLSRARVEDTIFSLRRAGKSELREGLQQIDDLLPKKDKFFETVLDELAVKDFSQVEPTSIYKGLAGSFIGSQIGASPGADLALSAAGIAATSPRAQSLVVRGAGALGRGSRAAQAAAGRALGTPLGQRAAIRPFILEDQQ